MRIIELITTATDHFASCGFESPRLEVEYLLGHVLGRSRLQLYLDFERPVTDAERDDFRALCRRRLAHEPLQHIIGTQDFVNITLKTDRRALIPRPETELVVATALDRLTGIPDPLAADLGTGSGAIALSLAWERPDARVVAVDISGEALDLARENARTLGLDNRVEFVEGDMLDALDGHGPFHAVISNPPYIARGVIPTLQEEVRDHDPQLALDGGADGLEFLSGIGSRAHRHLVPGGTAILECGHDQAEAVRDILARTGAYRAIDIIRDHAGHDRIVAAVKRED